MPPSDPVRRGMDEIARRVDLPRQIVGKCRKRFFEERMAGLEERAGGRPRVASRAWPTALPPEPAGYPARSHPPGAGSVDRQDDVVRWLTEDALRPWRHSSWLFPRDPAFSEKAGRVLNLYEGSWEGVPLTAADCVTSADEKTSIQARTRIHRTRAAPGEPMRVEQEYERKGQGAPVRVLSPLLPRVRARGTDSARAGRSEASTGAEPRRAASRRY